MPSDVSRGITCTGKLKKIFQIPLKCFILGTLSHSLSISLSYTLVATRRARNYFPPSPLYLKLPPTPPPLRGQHPLRTDGSPEGLSLLLQQVYTRMKQLVIGSGIHTKDSTRSAPGNILISMYIYKIVTVFFGGRLCLKWFVPASPYRFQVSRFGADSEPSARQPLCDLTCKEE